ncbi:MAG TPA: amidohydrolase family protein [Candidatus Binatia bacterium]|jgi:predicted TIM-barrel fold metal-dependent hydrolase
MIIDADGHLFETEEVFEKYMEPPLRNYRPRLLGDEEGNNFWVADGATRYKRPSIPGAGNPGSAAPPGKKIQPARRASPGSQTLESVKERLEDLDEEGIDVQYLYPSFLLHINSWKDGVLGNGVCRAYNTWLAKVSAEAPDRLKGVGLVCLRDPDGAAQEAKRIKELGLAAVMINGTIGPDRLDHPSHEPFFAEANRLVLPVAVHFSLEFPAVSELFPHFFPNRVLAGIFPIMAGFTSVMCSGLMERYANLRFAFLEGGCNWVPAYVERMDDHFENPRYNARQLIQRLPSEYLNSGRIFFGCEGNEAALGRIVHELGEDKLLYSSDYPHADRTEGTARFLERRDDLSAAARKKLLEDNAKRFYG